MSPVTLKPLAPRESLQRFLGAFVADPAVKAVYVGGSIARGNDDEASDVDLWVEGEGWNPESLGGLFLTAQLTQMGGIPFLHGVSTGGTIMDILKGTPQWDGYIRLDLPEPEPIVASPLPPCGLVEEFWYFSLKHRKNIWRDHHGLLVFGLDIDRRFLMRAWALHDTGTDPGQQAFTIFGLKALFEKHVDERRAEILGLPLRNREEIINALQQYRDEMSRLFPNTTLLESIVRSLPLSR